MIHQTYSDEHLIVVGSDKNDKFITFGEFASRADVAKYLNSKLRIQFLANLIENVQVFPDPEPEDSERRKLVAGLPEEFQNIELIWLQLHAVDEDSIIAHHPVDEMELNEIWNKIAQSRKQY